jgi:hypothetical protein
MAVSYTETSKTYGFEGSEGLALTIDPRSLPYTDDQLNAAVAAFADSLNSSGAGVTITQVVLSVVGTGPDDWTYTPAS